jgi:hypothetical protein
LRLEKAMKVELRGVLRPIVLDAERKPQTQSNEAKAAAERPETLQAAQELVNQSSRAQPQPRQIELQMPDVEPKKVALSVRDVNGDGRKDAVLRDESSGASAMLLANRQGQLEPGAISLNQPNAADLDRLATTGRATGAQFLATDLNGDGARNLAVKDGQSWLSLGKLDELHIHGPQASPEEAPVDEAESRYDEIIGELDWIVPAFAWDESFGGDSQGTEGQHDDPRGGMIGFVQMLSGNVDPNWLRASDMNFGDLGSMVMIDSMGGTVGAFDPFSVGMRLYGEKPATGGGGPSSGGPAATLPEPR